MNEAYATQISVEWNVPAYGVGYVTKFEVDTDYLQKFKVENVGGEIHNELWGYLQKNSKNLINIFQARLK